MKVKILKILFLNTIEKINVKTNKNIYECVIGKRLLINIERVYEIEIKSYNC